MTGENHVARCVICSREKANENALNGITSDAVKRGKENFKTGALNHSATLPAAISLRAGRLLRLAGRIAKRAHAEPSSLQLGLVGT